MKPYVHKVNYYETDRMGVTHHSNYIRFMEEARIDFLEQIGWGYEKFEAEGLGSPILSVSCEYKKTTTFPDEITVNVQLVRLTAVKFTLNYVMTVKDQVVCKGSSTSCFVDSKGAPVFIEKFHPDFYAILKEHLVKEEQ